MNNFVILTFIAGLYGYLAFFLVLIAAKKIMEGGDFHLWPKVRRYLDAFVGVFSAFLSLWATGEIRAILAIYSVSLILSSARRVFKVSNWPPIVRKVFNYIANSYIILAVFLMAPLVRELLGIEPIFVFLPAYFITYKAIWR